MLATTAGQHDVMPRLGDVLVAAETFGVSELNEEPLMVLVLSKSSSKPSSLRLISLGKAVLQAVSQSSKEKSSDDGMKIGDLHVVSP